MKENLEIAKIVSISLYQDEINVIMQSKENSADMFNMYLPTYYDEFLNVGWYYLIEDRKEIKGEVFYF